MFESPSLNGVFVLDEIYEEIRKYAFYALDYPKQLHEILNQAKDGEFQIRYRHIGLEKLYSKLDILAASLVISAIIIGSALFAIRLDNSAFNIAWFVVVVFLGVWVISVILKSGKS
ncbi:hypothetical protein [Candidatus Oleimmundimicrobium sp.]|uniref:hypothetical protein n=1 Tax=Candidatus Oleimmundimicrobium sp. TaxID=3060597 RepID=UPI002719FC7D|nr:hypothetical protein [Candidatus Oleimmundimicrobium sp.]MDO8886719.1 hypothetical protein [Candidatus Oleimmundimicrobium sp.]